MKVLFTFLFGLILTFLCLNAEVFGQASSNSKQSDFLKEFESPEDIDQLLHQSATNIDGIFISGSKASDSVLENGNTVVRNRSFEVEIGKIDGAENFNILKKIESNFEKSLKKYKFEYKELTYFPEGFNLRYSSSCVVGHINIRALYKGDTFVIFFIFNESTCKKQASRK